MPTPIKGEGRNKFVNRCIPIVMDEGTAKSAPQAVAICSSIWRKSARLNRRPGRKP